MAGHSKWANIRHRKGAQDARRGKIFTKLIREISSAAKTSPDPGTNPRLRLAIDKALSENMTRDTIDRAIQRGAGTGENDQLFEVRYEGYGPGGVAVMVECLTDNRNRTVSEVRHAFSKAGGNLGSDGSVAYLFQKKGHLYLSSSVEEQHLMDVALDLGAEDIGLLQTGEWDVVCAFEAYTQILEGFRAVGIEILRSEVVMQASVAVSVQDEEIALSLLKMFDVLEDLDDVQTLTSNADISENLLEKLSS